MAGVVIPLPVSVEQIALAVQHMSQSEQLRLLDLAPALRQLASQPPARILTQAQACVKQLRQRLLAFMQPSAISPTEPFLGGLTLDQYEALSEEEKAQLWATAAGLYLLELPEREVRPDATFTKADA